MKLLLIRCFLVLAATRPDGLENTDRMAPPGWDGNYWGPAGYEARACGELPPLIETPRMRRWDSWGRQVLRDGDVLFRLGDARIFFGYFPFSRFIARTSGSLFSHTGIVAVEDGEPFVYDTTKAGVRRMPFKVWILDNVGPMGVKRLRPEQRGAIPKVLEFCRRVFDDQVPFDYNLGLDDSAFYCVEMTEKAFRAAGLPLSEPIRLGDMENALEHPIAIIALQNVSAWILDEPLSLEQRVFFPGNERHGIWSSRWLVPVYTPEAVAGPGRGADEPAASEDTRDGHLAQRSRPTNRPAASTP
jgi:hypothetical protein